MAFDYRCPSCRAKLRLDEAQAPGTPIECPKCNETFSAPAQSEKAPKPEKPKDDKPAEPEKRKFGKNKMEQERVFINEFLLLGIVGAAMFSLIVVCSIVLWLLGRAARVEDMVALLPVEYNAIRGVSIDQMKRYPGFKADVEKIYDAPMREGYAELAKTVGQNPESLTYLVIAQDGAAGGSNWLYMFRVKKSFDPRAFAKLEGASPAGSGHAISNASSAPFLRGASVYCPSDQLIVVFKGSDPQGSMARMADVVRSEPREGTRAKIGSTGRLAIRAHFWTIIRPEGAMSNWLNNGAALIGQDMSVLGGSMQSATALATWCTVSGRGFRFGVGLECESAPAARGLVSDIRQGKLGKGDESEPPNQLKSALQIVNQKKEFGEFMQYIDFTFKQKCAYCTSRLESPEGSKNYLNFFTGVYWSTQGAK